MRDTTICYLLKKEEVLLAQKKRGFGKGWWNGLGGKVEQDESIEKAMCREVSEEIRVDLVEYSKVGRLKFVFPHKTEWNQLSHIFIATNWEGKPTETEEMRPEWFLKQKIPYHQMWPADNKWLPLAIQGKQFEGLIKLNNDGSLIDISINC